MITIEQMNETSALVQKTKQSRKIGGLCIAMGIVNLVIGTTVGVGCLIAGAVLRSK